MKAQDLRIGNWVNDGYRNHHHKVKAIAISLIELEDGSLRDYSEISPIPLTPEWLEKLGFKVKDYENMYDKDLTHGNILSVQIDNKKPISYQIGWELNWNMNTPIQYVHQLQNLYYSLTGTELKVEI